MKKKIRNIITKLSEQPELLFLADATGALITVFLLYIVLRNLPAYFYMPERILQYLSFIAIIFCLYSFSCFYWIKRNWAIYIRIIVAANLSYCVLTAFLVINNYASLSSFDILYFSVEIMVIILLVAIEWSVAKNIILSKKSDKI